MEEQGHSRASRTKRARQREMERENEFTRLECQNRRLQNQQALTVFILEKMLQLMKELMETIKYTETSKTAGVRESLARLEQGYKEFRAECQQKALTDQGPTSYKAH